MSVNKENEQEKQSETETIENADANNEQMNAGKDEGDNQEEVKSDESNEWEMKFNEMNDKYLRLYSEFENFRKRNAKERIDLIATASGGVIKNLLPVIDDFDRAIKANDESEDTVALKEGFSLIRQKMMNILTQEGLKPMESINSVFDTDLHEAITQIPAPSDDLKGKVVDVVEKGYYLNEKVLRFAKVVIGQ
ncbi:MAG: nucleotide exchange factor GrpE [Bacteroidota bacterium]